MSKDCSFSLEHYKDCLQLAKEKGYLFVNMNSYIDLKDDIKKTAKIIVMRHDVDHDLSLALNFAKIEKELGISATYFIRLHAKYNPYFSQNYLIIKELEKLGHELGLHHDCDFAALSKEEAEEFFRRDAAIFEKMSGVKLNGISAHEPNKSAFVITDKYLQKFGLGYQAYSDIFLKGLKYISDSSSRWREGCMCNFIKREEQRLCILTHPFWWFDKSPLENY